MSYGVNKPSTFIPKDARYRLIPYEGPHCHVCGRQAESLAPIYIPSRDTWAEDVDRVVVMGCISCYAKSRKLNVFSLEVLKQHVGKPRGRPPTKHLLVSAEEKAKLLEARKIYKEKILEINEVLKGKSELPEELGVETSELSDDDDLEFGMTEEQKRRMNEAVNGASSRVNKVYKETPNGH